MRACIKLASSLYSCIPHCTALHCILLNWLRLYCTVLHCIVQFSTVQCSAVQCRYQTIPGVRQGYHTSWLSLDWDIQTNSTQYFKTNWRVLVDTRTYLWLYLLEANKLTLHCQNFLRIFVIHKYIFMLIMFDYWDTGVHPFCLRSPKVFSSHQTLKSLKKQVFSA